jgi:hypothetical protein
MMPLPQRATRTQLLLVQSQSAALPQCESLVHCTHWPFPVLQRVWPGVVQCAFEVHSTQLLLLVLQRISSPVVQCVFEVHSTHE